MKLNASQNFQLDTIDKAIELIRSVQDSGQWETLQKAKEELYKARKKIENGYIQALCRNGNHVPWRGRGGEIGKCIYCGK